MRSGKAKRATLLHQIKLNMGTYQISFIKQLSTVEDKPAIIINKPGKESTWIAEHMAIQGNFWNSKSRGLLNSSSN